MSLTNLFIITDKLNLKNPNKNMALAHLSIYYTWRNIKSEHSNNLLLQLGMMNLICLIYFILFLIFLLIILLYKLCQ